MNAKLKFLTKVPGITRCRGAEHDNFINNHLGLEFYFPIYPTYLYCAFGEVTASSYSHRVLITSDQDAIDVVTNPFSGDFLTFV